MSPPAVYTLKFTSVLLLPPVKNVPPPGNPPISTLPAPILPSCADAIEQPANRTNPVRTALRTRTITDLLGRQQRHAEPNCYNFRRADTTTMNLKPPRPAKALVCLALAAILGARGSAQPGHDPAFA